MLKTIQISHTPVQFCSSAWIAHNEAMKAKRSVLGQGKKPRIGIFARWNTRPQPAVEIHTKRKGPTLKQAVRDILMLIGAVTVIGAMLSIGVAVGF